MKPINRYLILTVLLLFLAAVFSSCFGGAQNDRATSGERDGVSFCYLKDEKLLLLSGTGIKSANRIFTLPFSEDVEYLYIASGSSLEEGALDGLKKLKTVYFADDEKTVGYQTTVTVQYSVSGFETCEDLPFSHVIGHCPVNEKKECIICQKSFRYEYEDYHCLLHEGNQAIKNESIDIEGKTLRFDGNGYLEASGFLSLGGEVRYYQEGVFLIGTKDIDGVRCTFSNDGVLTGEKAIDSSIPAAQIIFPVVAVFVGVGVCFGVRKYSKFKEKKENEK